MLSSFKFLIVCSVGVKIFCLLIQSVWCFQIVFQDVLSGIKHLCWSPEILDSVVDLLLCFTLGFIMGMLSLFHNFEKQNYQPESK